MRHKSGRQTIIQYKHNKYLIFHFTDNELLVKNRPEAELGFGQVNRVWLAQMNCSNELATKYK